MPSSKRASVVVVKRKNKPNPNRRRAAKARVTFVGPRLRNGKTKRKKRTGKTRNSRQNMRGGIASDGLNYSRVISNTSVREQRTGKLTEKVANINGSTAAFTMIQALYLNPGNSVLFPVLSQEAALWEQYRVNHLSFRFCTDAYTANSTNVTAGKVIMATNFDPDDAQFTNDTQMENYTGSVRGPPYVVSMEHDVIAMHKKRRGSSLKKEDLALNDYYIYSSDNQPSPLANISKFYDIGLFQIASGSNAGTTEIGELYVDYDFTFIRRKQQTPIGQSFPSAHYSDVLADATAASPLGLSAASFTPRVSSIITITWLSGTTFAINLVGRFQVFMIWQTGSSDIAAAPTVVATTASTLVTNLIGNSLSSIGEFKASGLNATLNFTVDTTSVTNVITIGGLTSMAAGDFDIFISQVPSGLTSPEKAKKSGFTTNGEARIEKLERMLETLLLSNSRSISSPSTTPFEMEYSEHPPCEHVLRGIKLPSPEEQKDSLSAKIVPQSDLSNSTVSLLTSFLKTHTK